VDQPHRHRGQTFPHSNLQTYNHLTTSPQTRTSTQTASPSPRGPAPPPPQTNLPTFRLSNLRPSYNLPSKADLNTDCLSLPARTRPTSTAVSTFPTTDNRQAFMPHQLKCLNLCSPIHSSQSEHLLTGNVAINSNIDPITTNGNVRVFRKYGNGNANAVEKLPTMEPIILKTNANRR
jgi:hypothetical protein